MFCVQDELFGEYAAPPSDDDESEAITEEITEAQTETEDDLYAVKGPISANTNDQEGTSGYNAAEDEELVAAEAEKRAKKEAAKAAKAKAAAAAKAANREQKKNKKKK